MIYQSMQRFLKREELQMPASQKTTKEEFLSEHNKLSPSNLQATMELLSRFRIEKPSFFKDDNWPVYKIRRPFIIWLTSLKIGKRGDVGKNQEI